MQILAKLTTGAAVAAMSAAGVLAQATEMGGTGQATGGFLQEAGPAMLRVDDLLGAPVYVPDPAHGAADRRPDADWNAEAWEDVGAVADALISPQGAVVAMVVDVGGFLGIGSKAVAIPMDALTVRRNRDGDGDAAFPNGAAAHRIAVDLTRAQLEDAPAFEQETAADEAQAIAERVAAEVEARIARLDDYTREGYTAVARDSLDADALESVAVYDLNDDNIGAVKDVLLGEGGSIEHAVVDVGGWLGWGSHTVAVPFEAVRVLRSEDADLRVYVDYTRDEIERLPTHDS